ncbi:MAG: hypothetical protein PVJ64_16295 [Gemmatimonadales bacterium]|jgi:hypothetical protein
MPRLSRWCVRASLLYLVAGFTLGALLLVNKAGVGDATLWRLAPAHIEFLLVGWIVQLTMGVAFWILPRFRSGAPRGKVSWAWLAFSLLNAGALAAGLGPLLAKGPWVAAAGRAAELSAAVAFAIHAWPRVKAVDMSPREPAR